MHVTPKYKIDLARQLRAKQTPAEAILWERLRRNGLSGLGFRRQHPIGRFVADFCCEAAHVIIEVDSGYHNTAEQKMLDTERTAHFTGLGYQVLRFTNEEVIEGMNTVLDRIRQMTQAGIPADTAK